MLSPALRRETLKKLRDEILGLTISEVLPHTEDEGLFTLVLLDPLTEDKKKMVKISGNDLGWWFEVS